MTLEEFRDYLRSIDEAVNAEEPVFDVNAREVNDRAFAYDFQGFLSIVLFFDESGEVDEWTDVIEVSAGPHFGPDFTHASVEEWIETTIGDYLANVDDDED